LSPARAWAALAAGLAIGAVVARFAPAAAIDWQPGLAASQPWRAWSAAAVHYSDLHLAANLAGAALVAWLGMAARVRGAEVAAWAIAWPLTQFGLLLRPELAHYGGLSGVLHAGVAIAALHVLVNDALPRRRLIGAAILVLLGVKVIGESPWGPALTHPAGWDIAVAPFAHASGLVAGLLCGALAAALRWARRRG
jgi:rhomboid family GlyGly-CTERM serine protease